LRRAWLLPVQSGSGLKNPATEGHARKLKELMKNTKHGAGIAATLLLACGAVSAAEPGEYGLQFGMDAGSTNFHVRKSRLDEFSGAPTSASTLDSSDAGFSLSAGFRFSPYLAVEAAYLDLGAAEYVVRSGAAAVPLDLASQGAAFSVLGTLPLIRPFLLEGRAGIYLGDAKLHVDPQWNSLPIPPDVDDLLGSKGGVDAALMLGAGLVARLGPHWSVRLGYDYISEQATVASRPPISGDPSSVGVSINSGAGRLSLGFRVSF
jgi:opacity protein-like surface antigen